jgi:hypothetical protein
VKALAIFIKKNPHNKKKINEEYSNRKQTYKGKKNKKKIFKKRFCTKEENNS